MAVVKGPALSIAASGNMGAICYSTWRELQVARGVWTGTVPNTPAQQTIQGYLTDLSQHWGANLSESDREAWRQLARVTEFSNRFGEPVHYSGYNLFVSRNMYRLRWGVMILDTPPVETGSMIFDWWETEWQLAQARVRLRVWEDATTVAAFCCEFWKAGPYTSPGRRPIEPEWRCINIDFAVGFGYFDYDVIANRYYWYRFRLGLASGVVMPFQVLPCDTF